MKKDILVIDDQKSTRFLLLSVLGGDFNVVTAPDHHSAFYMLSKKKLPDLIIVSTQQTDMADWELIEHFITHRSYKDIPLLVLSNYSKIETTKRCLRMGIQEYFLKPFNPLDLLNTVQRMMDTPAFYALKRTAG